MVSKELFDKAQEVLNQTSRTKSKTFFFPLRGVMRCKKCGCMLTAALKKGFRYYYCTNGKGNCDQGRSYMREEFVSEKLASVFDQLHFDEELIEIMYRAAKEKTGIDNGNNEQAVSSLKNELGLIVERESRLTDGFASGTVRNDLYQTKMAELNNQRVELERQLARLNKKTESDISALEQTKIIFLKASRAKKEFIEGDDDKKHDVINTLLWNAWFMDKEISETRFKSPYCMIAETPKNADFVTMRARRDLNP